MKAFGHCKVASKSWLLPVNVTSNGNTLMTPAGPMACRRVGENNACPSDMCAMPVCSTAWLLGRERAHGQHSGGCRARHRAHMRTLAERGSGRCQREGRQVGAHQVRGRVHCRQDPLCHGLWQGERCAVQDWFELRTGQSAVQLCMHGVKNCLWHRCE